MNLAYRLATAMSECLNGLSILASPILLMRLRKDAERRGRAYDVEPLLAEYVALIAGMSEGWRKSQEAQMMIALAEDAEEIRRSVARFTDKKNNVDRAIIDAARAALARAGIAEPSEGWDRYTGPKS